MTVYCRVLPPLLALAVIAALPGCGRSKADSMLLRESFSSEDTYSRKVAVTPAAACEAARRALLSQGYGISRADAAAVEGNKNFQPSEETHEQLSLRVSCVAQGDDQEAWIFVSAVQDRYSLKKSATSASVGVGVLGSVSLPVGSSNDSMVRVASSTVQDGDFYRRFFDRLDLYLPKGAAAPVDKAKGEAPPPAPPALVPQPVAPAAVETVPAVAPPAVTPAVPEPVPAAPQLQPEAQPAPEPQQQQPLTPEPQPQSSAGPQAQPQTTTAAPDTITPVAAKPTPAGEPTPANPTASPAAATP